VPRGVQSVTSANVTYYNVYKDGKLVKTYSQNCLCKQTVREKLAQHTPAQEYGLIAVWPDEDEVDHYSREMNLNDYLMGEKIEWED